MKTFLKILSFLFWLAVMPLCSVLMLEEFFCFDDVRLSTGFIVSVLVQAITILTIRGGIATWKDYHKPRYTPPNQ